MTLPFTPFTLNVTKPSAHFIIEKRTKKNYFENSREIKQLIQMKNRTTKIATSVECRIGSREHHL